MNTLSIKQPMATLVCAGVKDVENRTWATNYRGKLLIHASGNARFMPIGEEVPEKWYNSYIGHRDSGNMDDVELLYYKLFYDKIYPFYGVEDWQGFLDKYAVDGRKMEPFFISHAIIGEVEITDIVSDSQSLWAISGCEHWILKNPVLYDRPIISVQGKRGIWNFNKGE